MTKPNSARAAGRQAILDELLEEFARLELDAMEVSKENVLGSQARSFCVGKANAFRESGNVVLRMMGGLPATVSRKPSHLDLRAQEYGES